MENVLIDQSTGGYGFRRRTVGGGCRRLAVSSQETRSAYNSFPYTSATPFQYTPYNLYSSPSLPLLPSHHPPLLPLPPAAMTKHATFPYRPAPPPPAAATKVNTTTTTGMTAAAAPRKMGEYKRKKPRTPRSTEEPPRAQRRKPLERAAPLPPAPAMAEALDDLEREVARGFVEDLLHALAPPPSSLPQPTFSLVRAVAAKAAASCTV